MRGRIPLRMRIMSALAGEPDWDSITAEEVVALRAKQVRLANSAVGRIVTGRTDSGAEISTHTLDLPGRGLAVRVHRPVAGGAELPLIVAFHGGGFIGGVPEQDDWLLSHLAVHGPAVVASVDYRLAPEHFAPAAIEDGRDALVCLRDRAAEFGVDPTRIALLGASAGATIAALVALAAEDLGVPVRAQVLINPALDWTDRMSEYPSFVENADTPTATPANCRAVQRIALAPGFDAAIISPIRHAQVAGVAPALIQAAGLDALEDQAAAYADRLRAANVPVTLTRYAEATHAFLSMSGLVPAAGPARAEIAEFLRGHLAVRAVR